MATRINGIKVGSSNITATYGGLTSTAVLFTVVAKSIAGCTVTLGTTSFTYNGTAQGPTVTVKDGTKTLVAGTDYTVSGNSNTNAGTYTITITGKGNYTGTNTSASYTIGKADFTVDKKFTSDGKQTWVYDGSAHGNGVSATGADGGTSYTIKYRTSATGAYTLTSAPQITNVSESKTIYYQIVDPNGNHNEATGSYTLQITQRTVTANAPTASNKNWTGSAQTLFTKGSCSTGGVMYYIRSTSETAPAFSTSTWTTNPTLTDTPAGKYYLHWYCYVADTANNTGTNINKANTISATISAIKATISSFVGDSVSAGNVEYEQGTAKPTVSATGGTVYYRTSEDNSTWSDWSTTVPTRTAVGSTYVQCYVKGDANHTDSDVSSTVTITVYKADDANVVVTINTATLTYNKESQNLTSAITPHGATAYVGLGASDSVAPTSWFTAGTQASAINAGTYYVWYKFTPDGNHSNSNSGAYVGSKTINPYPINGSRITVTPSATSFTYNKSAQGPTITVKDGTATLVAGTDYTVTGNSNTNAGTYTVTITGKGNYSGTNTSVTYTIGKADGTGSVSINGWVYGETANNPTPTSATNGTTDVTYEWFDSSKTKLSAKPNNTSNAGTYYVKATFKETANYKSYTTDYKSFTITQREVTLTWGSTLTWTYDKSTHSTTCTAGNLVNSDTCTVTLTGNSVGPNVGTSTVSATGLSNTNYKLPTTGLSKTLTIGQKEVKVVWGTPSSWVYDGTSKSTTCTVDSSSLISGDTCTVTLTGNSVGPNVGSATVTASELSNTNYKLPATKPTTTISITQANGSGSVTIGNWVYGNVAASHSASSSTNPYSSSDVTYTWYDSNKNALSAKPNNKSNAGTYYVKATFPANTNYKSYTTDYKSFTITQREVTLTWSTPTTWIYDKSAHSVTCTAGNLVNSDTCTVTLTGNSVGPNVGSSTALATGLSNTNYKLPTKGLSTPISITQREVTLTWGTISWVYNGSERSTTCVAGNVVSGDTCNVTLTGNKVGPNVGTATVTAASLSNTNYKLPADNTKVIEITIENGNITYDTISGELFCTETANAMSKTDAAKNVAIATASATSTSNPSGITYAISVKKGTTDVTGWTIDSTGKTVTIPANTASGTYSVTITATAAGNTNYKSASVTPTAKNVVIKANSLESLVLTLNATEITYGDYTTPRSVVATYTNNATKDVVDDPTTTYASTNTGVATITNS